MNDGQNSPATCDVAPDQRRRCGRSGVGQGTHLHAIPADVRSQLKPLRRPDNWRNLIYLGHDWAVIAAAVACSLAIRGLVPYLAAVLVIGSRQRALMNLVHQASHRKLFRTRRLNDWLGRAFAAFPLVTSLEAYACAHCRHHGFLWDRERDPKAVRYSELGLIAPPQGLSEFARKHLVKPAVLLAHVPFNVAAALSWYGEPVRERLGRVGFWTVALAAVFALGQERMLLMYWIVPFLTTFQIIRYWTEMAEHASLPARSPWMATRSWTSSWLVRWLLAPHTDHYHLAHHLFPAIPHYRMAEAHRLLMQVPEYVAGHHCDGFFWPRRPDAPSVVQDICWPDALARYKRIPATLGSKAQAPAPAAA